MIPPARTVGEALTNAHENVTTYAHILAKKMAERAVRIAQEKPLDPSVRSPSLVAAAYIALAEIPVRSLHLRLIPAAMRLIESHGAGHKIHDMDPQFWKLGNDSAVELICECLLRSGQEEIVQYMREGNIQRHILHDPVRIKFLDAGYTHSAISSGSHHEFDTLWKSHDTRRTLPEPEDDTTNNQRNRKTINSLLHLTAEGSIVPILEADKIEEKPECTFTVTSGNIKLYTRPQKRRYLKSPDIVDPEEFMAALENRDPNYYQKNMTTEFVCEEMCHVPGFYSTKAVCDNGIKIARSSPWTIYTITDGSKTVFVHIHEQNYRKSFSDTVKHNLK